MRCDLPFPETLPALAAQLVLLRAGRKRLVLLPHGLVPEGVLNGLHTLDTARGTFAAADPRALEAVPDDLARDQIGLALGYGVPAKPAQPDRGITLRDVFGREILTVVADAATEAAATAALQAMATEGMTVDRTQLRAILRSRAWWWLHFFETLQPDNPEITP